VRYQWFEGDVRAARDARVPMLRAIAGSTRYAIGARHRLLRAHDPVPGVVVAWGLGRNAAQKLVPSLGTRG
jgi:hypothetical protein